MKRKILKACSEILDYLQSISPFDTGNLREQIKGLEIGENEYQISIGGPLAPYAVYTNEKWVSPRWKGRENPNEHWINMGVEKAVYRTAAFLKGEVSFNNQELIDRWDNKSYWDSPEGQAKLKEYRLNDTG